MDRTRHAGSRALVSGAGSGIGRAVVLRLLGEGAHVTGFDRDEEGLATLYAEAGVGNDRLEVFPGDVRSDADIAAMVEGAADIDILVNNAGVMDHFVPITEVSDDLWDTVIGINLTGVMRLSRAVLPLMLDNGGGSVVTVASKGSLSAGASGVAYTASKHGVLGLAKHIAWFYGPRGIRSNAVCPGAVATSIGSSAEPHSQWAMERAAVALATMGAVAEPDQIAAAISWLASAEASDVNGAVLTVDGGWSVA